MPLALLLFALVLDVLVVSVLGNGLTAAWAWCSFHAHLLHRNVGSGNHILVGKRIVHVGELEHGWQCRGVCQFQLQRNETLELRESS